MITKNAVSNDGCPRSFFEISQLLVAASLYALFNVAMPLIRLPHGNVGFGVYVLGVLVSTSIFMWLQLRVLSALGTVAIRLPQEVIVIFASIALWIAILSEHKHFPTSPMSLITVSLMLNLAITFGCGTFGRLVSRIVKEPNVLLPISLVAIPIDFFGAMMKFGFTNNMVRAHPGIVKNVSVGVPSFLNHGASALVQTSLIGPGDIVFITFFFTAVRRLNMNCRATFNWMYAGLTVAMLVVIFVPGFAVAALIPMGFSVIAANWRHFRLSRAEAFATGYVIVMVVALALSFYVYTNIKIFRG